jgi:hypothetical protein
MLFDAGHARNRSLYTADIALHHAKKPSPDLEAAADATHRAIAYLPDVRSQRLLRSLRDIANVLSVHRKVPCVADCLDAYRTAVPTTA